jgi:hypothetical protein
MTIITQIPACYFIYIEDENYQYKRWINLAHVSQIDIQENYLEVKLNSGHKTRLEGKAKQQFLEEITEVNRKYKVGETT